MERILCRRCVMLKTMFVQSQRNLVQQKNVPRVLSTNIKTCQIGAQNASGVRYYATKDRLSEQKYKHGKLIEEKYEDPTIYPYFLMIFSSTDEAVLDGYLHFVRKAAKMVDVDLTKSFNMPAIEETFKAKREAKSLASEMEYNLKQYRRVVELQDLTGDESDIFLEYLQKAMPAGVKVEVQLKQWERYVDPNHIMFRSENAG